jgi:hypothetical protein
MEVWAMTRRSYTVTLDLPSGADDGDAREFIQRAVVAEVGHCHPSDPMSDLDRQTVEVARSRQGRGPRKRKQPLDVEGDNFYGDHGDSDDGWRAR